MSETRKAVILARGLGKRMRAAAPAPANLNQEQIDAAEHGIKGMIPFPRPFLDYAISALADAGCNLICLVIGPEHEGIRKYYQQLAVRRVAISFAVQPHPLGTADAVAAAAEFTAADNFLVVNSDNYYPVEGLRRLRMLASSGVIGFERAGLLQYGNIGAERLSGYAILHRNQRDELERIEEKPASADPGALIGMNAWSFTPRIFTACAAIERSVRGEYELPSAVQYAIGCLGERFRVVPYSGGVLDLSTRGDIGAVAGYLEDVAVDL